MPQSDQVVVFDLDDTLYKERDYVSSGVAAVIKQCQALGLIDQLREDQPFVPDIVGGKFIDALCEHLGLSARLQQSLLWMYRLHEPSICLDEATRAALQNICAKVKSIAIITDGRAASQRLKIKALGLNDIPAFVSEEFEFGKPAPDMFLAVERRWPGCRYAYVGDNTSKDFVAPNALGWLTVGLRDDGSNIHRQRRHTEVMPAYLPRAWVQTFAELPEFLFGNPFAKETSI